MSSGASTSGSSTGTSSSMSGSGSTPSTGTSTGVADTGVGSAVAPSQTGTSTAATGTTAGSMSGTGMAAGSASAPGTDMNAFMASFATMQDPTFLMTAASSNMLEIQMGKLAVQKSANAEVKKFGQMMVDHHTKATQELKTVAVPLGVTLPQTLMPIHQTMADQLTGKSGKAFDEAYMDAMEAAHKMDVAMFEVKSKGAETPTVQSFATKTLPMLRSHHTMANEIEKKVD
ncbi:DUF4142 domain-containing protein [Hymenobacter lucidus]|uniref:DUF4142 domain-containing protein n=1 Tax=Hymenobacter lucidus TaxID=2880930 RepID=A0ABS8AQR2_9BACT|nr:DUF4142 domain-containing protein [Hymenobacter lucidus]MCB2408563.1 DUF4142 domain-containing protein [Hymenobacter lucidus]